ncbi:MAG: hypothetical protein OXI41_00890 [Chloroflexota bacterium]|nr:hypothetical protein [Chloroflexota bacterium]MDE2896198.1 hypothetical protein [Chloroflexota bacterium]
MVSNSEQIPDADRRPVELGEFQRSIAQINTRIDDLRSDMNARIDDLRSDMNARSDDLRSDMKSGQAWMRWGIGLILALTLTLMGLILSGVG